MRFPWTERRSNESIVKEISPEYSLEGLMLKLKLQYLQLKKKKRRSMKAKTTITEVDNYFSKLRNC